MKILIGQPIHEEGIIQLEHAVNNYEEADIILYPEGYISDEEALAAACRLAKENQVMIITSYRKDQKDRAAIISREGKLILERAKTPPEEAVTLYEPLIIQYNQLTIGYLLCMEILKGARDLHMINEMLAVKDSQSGQSAISFIAHPIGVGMFSEEQFDQWISEARNIAKLNNTMVIGTSHADGSYRNCGVSIPISYCINHDGEPIYISKSDTRTRIVNLDTNEVKVIES